MPGCDPRDIVTMRIATLLAAVAASSSADQMHTSVTIHPPSGFGSGEDSIYLVAYVPLAKEHSWVDIQSQCLFSILQSSANGPFTAIFNPYTDVRGACFEATMRTSMMPAKRCAKAWRARLTLTMPRHARMDAGATAYRRGRLPSAAPQGLAPGARHPVQVQDFGGL